MINGVSKMLIGSNNSLTYLRPSSWWSRVFKWFSRCQSATYREQYEYCGVRLFDLRLYADEHCHIIARNGNRKYSIFSLYEILGYFDKKGDVTVRITFESSLSDLINDGEYNRIINKFVQMCNIIETIYPNIKYFGGHRSCDDKELYSFNYEKSNGTPKIRDKANNSWLYSKLPILSSIRNRYNIKKYEKEDGFLLLNFVDRR